jgi:23S rRNA (uracil1939-C5)-methyltransferase
VPSGAFTQVNWRVNLELVSRVVAGARARAARSFLDLYAGVGNFAIPLASAGLSGVAIEKNRSAARALSEAARAQKLACEAVAGEVGSSLARLVKKGQRFELVVLDPPRAGAKDAVRGVLSLAPQTIAYVACDPVTLARDVRALRSGGFELVEVTCFDMFPQTHHVETLAWLSRGVGSGGAVT